jgi:hypothetical protein
VRQAEQFPLSQTVTVSAAGGLNDHPERALYCFALFVTHRAIWHLTGGTMDARDLNVKVAVRCRPMSSKETARGCGNIITINHNKVHIKAVDTQHEDKDFTFDHCYGSDSLQTTVYTDLGRPIVLQALDGFNGTIFAYGQTGSGKSFSMMGDAETKGIIPQLNEDLFEKLALKLEQMEESALQQDINSKTKFMVTVSFLEVYNEDIKDLLNPSDKKLNIRENPKMGIYVEDLCELVGYSTYVCQRSYEFVVCDSYLPYESLTISLSFRLYETPAT